MVRQRTRHNADWQHPQRIGKLRGNGVAPDPAHRHHTAIRSQHPIAERQCLDGTLPIRTRDHRASEEAGDVTGKYILPPFGLPPSEANDEVIVQRVRDRAERYRDCATVPSQRVVTERLREKHPVLATTTIDYVGSGVGVENVVAGAAGRVVNLYSVGKGEATLYADNIRRVASRIGVDQRCRAQIDMAGECRLRC